MPDFNKLKFIWISDPNVIAVTPKYLLEQVEGRSWNVERLCKFAPLLLANDANYFWVLVDDDQITKGILWVVIDVLSEKLNVIVFSVDEEYQGAGHLESVRDFLRQFIKDYNKREGEVKLKEKINWVTARPEIFNEMGGRRPKTILLEV